jgi:nucleoside 2-deoxyribosyltransferase
MVEIPRPCYLSVRIVNTELAAKVQSALESRGIKVFNPCLITPPKVPHKDIPKEVADACYAMMEKSGCTVLIAGQGDDFGGDCAAELGFTHGAKKPVYILVDGDPNRARERMTEIYRHTADFPVQHFVNNFEDLAKLMKQ